MAKQIEDEPLPWYLVNTIVDPDTEQYFNKRSNAVKIQKNKSPLEKWLVKGIQATHRRIAGKSPQRNINYLFY